MEALRGAYEVAGEPLTNQEVDSPRDALEDIVDVIGREHTDWLMHLAGSERLNYGPLLASTAEVLANPLFWFERSAKRYACFAVQGVPAVTARRLEDEGVRILTPGTAV